jgi:hypothetical protein
MTITKTIAAVAVLAIGTFAFSAPAFAWSHHHHHGDAFAAGAFGFAAGTFLGAAMAQPQREVIYVQPQPNDWVSYCYSKHPNTYNPATNLYIGYDGRYHQCR